LIGISAAFVGFMALGVPIAFVIGIAGAIGIFNLDLRPMLIPQRMFNGVDSFILLAAPFYILAGELMGRAGITERLVKLSMLVTGHFRGGTAFGSVVSAVLFSGISGTAVGDTAALGQIFIRQMPKEGYSTEYSAALVVAGSMIGPIVPPSVTLVVFSAVSQLSVIDLFVAGVIPGLLLATACACVILVHVFTRNLPYSRFVLGDEPILRVVVEGFLVTMLPIILLGGALSGVFTAAEAGGVAVLYTLFLGCVIFRRLSPAVIWQALIATARVSASIYFVLAASQILSYALASAGATQWAAQFGVIFAGQPIFFMLSVVVFLILIGAFLEPGPAMVIFVPLLLPVARSMGIDPMQFSIVFVLTLALGLSTPPIGLCLFIACKIGKIRMGQLFRAMWPFFFAEKMVVILLVLVPWFSTWLPHLLHR
jgi:tripartite ATP-independent transporter DctM subunit